MAANAGIIDGGDIMVYINTGTAEVPVWTAGAHCTEHSIKNSTEVRTRSTKDTGQFDEKRGGKQNTTISISALATYGAYSYYDYRALQLAKTPVLVKYSGRPAAEVTAGKCVIAEQVGDKFEKGLFLITACDRNDAKDADSTLSVTLENSGAVTIETVAAP